MQGIIGYPLAAAFLRGEAKRLVKGYNAGTVKWTRTVFEGDETAQTAVVKKKLIPPLAAKYQTPFVLLGKACLVSLLSFWISNLTGGAVHRYVVCLIMGVVAQEIGFLEHDVMKKSNCYGIGLVICIVSILVFLTAVTPQDVLSLLPVVLDAFVIGLLSMFVIAVVVGKIFKFSWQMACGIACSCLFGFPGTFVVSTEVSKQIGTTDDERQMLLDNIMPKMLVAGFVCLTITSVVITGVFVNYLVV